MMSPHTIKYAVTLAGGTREIFITVFKIDVR